jgi:hypothetical protein
MNVEFVLKLFVDFRIFLVKNDHNNNEVELKEIIQEAKDVLQLDQLLKFVQLVFLY